MNNLLTHIALHGYLLIFLIAFLEAIDIPLPASLALVVAGAAAASGTLHASLVYLLGTAGLLLGDSIIYFLGRYMGWTLLGFLCKVSINPETCILRSAELFYKRGKTTLIVAKFIPGINTMAPPLAGSMKMRFEQFLWLDFLGTSLYVITYTAIGFVFHKFITSITHGFNAASHAIGIVALVAVIAYVAYRFSLFFKNRVYRVVPRVQVEELARRLKAEETERLLVVDVRSHGYYDAGTSRIKGSIRLEPNNFAEEIKKFPKDKDLYVYCT
ncbi:MAG TPA: VTT domain-containing protein [Terriglobales bacterium]|nr:VTT domain-containing protein [Terriglobales bacterium]